MDPKIEAVAHQRLQAAEAEHVTRKAKVTLGTAFAEFWKHPSPWLISLSGGIAIVARFARGDWRWTDALVPAILLATFPVVEWLIHVFILHWRPRTVAGVTIDSLLARKHREHHADPRDVPLVFIPWPVFLWLLPLLVVIAVVVFPLVGLSLELGLTYLGSMTVLGILYEWTHFLIHTAHRPRSRYHRSVWRNHRLHHFKNEHYWHGITNNFSDRVLGTNPDQSEVPKSRTARTLSG
jgi:hypothetical protein